MNSKVKLRLFDKKKEENFWMVLLEQASWTYRAE